MQSASTVHCAGAAQHSLSTHCPPLQSASLVQQFSPLQLVAAAAAPAVLIAAPAPALLMVVALIMAIMLVAIAPVVVVAEAADAPPLRNVAGGATPTRVAELPPLAAAGCCAAAGLLAASVRVLLAASEPSLVVLGLSGPSLCAAGSHSSRTHTAANSPRVRQSSSVSHCFLSVSNNSEQAALS